MTGTPKLDGLDVTREQLRTQVEAVAAAVLASATSMLADEVAGELGDDAVITVSGTGGRRRIHVSGRAIAQREFGSRTQPARPFVRQAVARTKNRLKRGETP